MPPRIRVTKLVTLTGSELCSWYGHETSVFDEAREAVGLWAYLSPAEVGFDGDCFTVDDEPVASLETFYVPSTPRLRAPLGKDQSAARPVAMEAV